MVDPQARDENFSDGMTMEIFFATFEAMAFLIGIGTIGFLILAKKLVGEDIMHVLSPLALEVALPCMIFNDIVTKFDPLQTPAWWSLPLVWFGFTAVTLALSLAAGYLVAQDRRNEFRVSLFFPNAIFVPFAVLEGVFGRQSPLVTELFLLTLFFSALLFNTFGLFFPRKRSEKRVKHLKKILHPVVIVTFAAICISTMDAKEVVPDFVLKIARSLGAMALPLIMLLIGGSIYIDYKKKGTVDWFSTVLFVLVKNLVFPALTLLFIWLARLPQSVAVLLFLQSAVPPVTSIPVFTARFGGKVSLTNQFLIGSFLVSVVSIPAGMWILKWLYPDLF